MENQQLPAQVQKMKAELDQKMKEANISPGEVKPKQEEVAAPPVSKEPEHREEPEPKDNSIKKKPPFTDDTVEAWKGRFNALQGKYNAEIKALQDDVNLLSSLKSQVRVLNQQINESDVVNRDLKLKLEQKESVSPPKKVEVPKSIKELLSSEELAYMDEVGFDDKSMEIFGNLITAKMSSIPQHDNSKSVDIEAIKQDADTIRNASKNAFWVKFREAVPDWEAINNSKSFKAWIWDTIPYTNITWNESLQSAQDAFDDEKVVNIFNAFKKENPQKPKPEPLYIDPEKHIDPSSSVGAEVKPKQEKIWTLAEINKLSQDVIHKRISAEDFAKKNAEIMQANKEGRITN